MKKMILLIVILGIAAFTTYRLLSGKEKKSEEKKDRPLSIGKNSDSFNTSFSKLMNDYYAVKDALVEWDTVKANHAAASLQQSSDSLQLKELKADSNVLLTAQSLASSVSSEAKGFIGENDIEQKRRALNMLTDELYNLIRTVRYNGEIIYHDRCPMAFKETEEAYWLSNSNKIINPYLGKNHPTYKNKMLGCGEIVDSLDFTKK